MSHSGRAFYFSRVSERSAGPGDRKSCARTGLLDAGSLMNAERMFC